MCKFYLSSFQRLLGPDGISPAHPSLTLDAHDCGSDSFSITTQLSLLRGTPACCVLLNGRGLMVDGKKRLAVKALSLTAKHVQGPGVVDAIENGWESLHH